MLWLLYYFQIYLKWILIFKTFLKRSKTRRPLNKSFRNRFPAQFAETQQNSIYIYIYIYKYVWMIAFKRNIKNWRCFIHKMRIISNLSEVPWKARMPGNTAFIVVSVEKVNLKHSSNGTVVSFCTYKGLNNIIITIITTPPTTTTHTEMRSRKLPWFGSINGHFAEEPNVMQIYRLET